MANRSSAGPSGTGIVIGKDGPQVIRRAGARWSDAAEARFLDHLAATCNVTAAAEAAGFTGRALYYRRRSDPGFAKRWQAALETGYAHVETLLLQRAIEALEGFAPDPTTPVEPMTVKEARELLGHHRDRVHGGPRSRRKWSRPRTLDEVRDSILRKLEAIAPCSPSLQGEGDHPAQPDGGGSPSSSPHGEGDHPEGGGGAPSVRTTPYAA